MLKTTHTDKNQTRASLEEQASKDNIFFSESLNGIIDENLSESPTSLSDSSSGILTVGSSEFSIFPLKIERVDQDIFIDFKIHNFDIYDFINFDIATTNIAQKNINCKLISYCHPTEKAEYGLIRILLLEGT